MLLQSRIRSALTKPAMPVLFFFAGVTYDGLTLTRIDRLLDNLILLLYLVLLGLLIILMGRAEVRAPSANGSSGPPADLTPATAELIARGRPYYPYGIQFLFGGLFSAYAIFYSRSASLTSTAVFFFILVALLVANEFLRNRFSRLELLVSLYAVVCLSFFTFFLPVLTGWMNTWVFLAGAVLSGLVVVRVLELVFPIGPARLSRDVLLNALPPFALIGILVGFYFLGWIPPVPLALKTGGVYHKVVKDDDGYQVSYEKGAWYQMWKRSDDPFRGDGPIYCFTAVFAPAALQTTIVHHWQYRPAGASFLTTDRIPITIAGGREQGYRGYTVKQRVEPGDWRVDVETADGRLIGRIHFRAQARDRAGPPELDTRRY